MTIYKWESEGEGYKAKSRATVRPPELFDLSSIRLHGGHKGLNHYHARHLKSGEEELFMIEHDGYLPRLARGMVEKFSDNYLERDQAELAALATI